MTTPGNSEHDATRLAEELTAYLDGELDAESREQVERRLVQDPVYRGEMQQLHRTWDLLTRLPRAAAGESFARTTLEMAALAAEAETGALRRAWLRRLFTGVTLAAACGTGFLFGQWLWSAGGREQENVSSEIGGQSPSGTSSFAAGGAEPAPEPDAPREQPQFGQEFILFMQDELLRFFVQDLSPEEQERLLKLSANERMHELQRLYLDRFARSLEDDSPPDRPAEANE